LRGSTQKGQKDQGQVQPLKNTLQFLVKNTFKVLEASREPEEIEDDAGDDMLRMIFNVEPETDKKNAKKTKRRWTKMEVKPIYGLDEIEDGSCGMVFHKTEAKKMLASVDKIVEAGNEVKFARGDRESYIMNLKTKKKIILIRERGVYVMKVKVMAGGRRANVSIVIDSGAAECVMPKDWFPECEELEAKKGVRFAGADGNDLGNFGRRVIQLVPTEGFTGRA